MFVIELIYKADLSAIDAHMPAHMKSLKKYCASAIAREDPFYEHGLAEVRIIEFRASQRADDVQKRIDSFIG